MNDTILEQIKNIAKNKIMFHENEWLKQDEQTYLNAPPNAQFLYIVRSSGTYLIEVKLENTDWLLTIIDHYRQNGKAQFYIIDKGIACQKLTSLDAKFYINMLKVAKDNETPQIA